MSMSKVEAANTAISIVTAGLSSGAIKLNGNIDPATASSNATADAQYLNTLIGGLTTAIQALDS